MLNLADYNSSGDEGASEKAGHGELTEQAAPLPTRQAESGPNGRDGRLAHGVGASRPRHPDKIDGPSLVQPVTVDNGVDAGPVVGPQIPPAPSPTPDDGFTSGPQSPYSSTRSLIRDLTLPPVPNLDIPPSPPGSPPASTTAKFTNFLELKKKGIHFNDKLAQSSALKNPSLLAKLMGFAGVDDKAQYASSLPTSVWDPDAFPAWAYKDALAKSQKDLQKQLEEEKAQRQALEFVPAAAPDDSGRGPANVTPSGGRSLGKSAAERVMAGLDREKYRSPAAGDGRGRREADRKDPKLDYPRPRRDRSRSPSRERRRRSRSR